MHSEIQAIINASNKITKPIIVDIFVSRFTKDMKPKVSRPCNLCLDFVSNAENVTVRRVYYFNRNNNLVYENLRDMEHVYNSAGYRNLSKCTNIYIK
jgi:cytidine deaminase